VRKAVVRAATVGWRPLVILAIVALALAALATVSGNHALSRTFGTLAWTAAFIGSVSGLLVGVGRKVPT